MKFFSFVADLIDVTYRGKVKETNHYGTLILEQLNHQVYWVSTLDRNEHGQMGEDEVVDYIDHLETRGFRRVDRESIEMGADHPNKYYIMLSAYCDWNIEEILVINRFADHPVLMELVGELNMSGLTHKLMDEEWNTTKEWVDDRGNFQLNHGSNHLDMGDSTKIVGMNVANNHKQPATLQPGLDGDGTMEDNLLREQIVITKILDYIAEWLDRQPISTKAERMLRFSTDLMLKRILPRLLSSRCWCILVFGSVEIQGIW